MKRLLLLALLFLLIACVPEYQPPPEQPQVAPQPVSETQPLQSINERIITYPYTKVWQTRGDERILWGYDQQGKLILLNSSKSTIVFTYDADKLIQIDDNSKPTNFMYDKKNQLISSQKGKKIWTFTYTAKGKLLSMENDEKLSVAHDSKGRLSSVARDGGASTEFEYDNLNRTKKIYKSYTETATRYDSEGRLTRLDRQDDHLVLAYWRYDLLSSLSGTMYGIKETVNYGPTSITLVSNVEQNEFTSQYSEDSEARLKSFNTFLFCTRFRKLPVIFDGQSWVLYHEYMKGNITNYLLTSFICDYLP